MGHDPPLSATWLDECKRSSPGISSTVTGDAWRARAWRPNPGSCSSEAAPQEVCEDPTLSEASSRSGPAVVCGSLAQVLRCEIMFGSGFQRDKVTPSFYTPSCAMERFACG